MFYLCNTSIPIFVLFQIRNKIEGLLPLFWGPTLHMPFKMNLYYNFQHRLNDKHDNVHFQQKLQYIHEGQFLR